MSERGLNQLERALRAGGSASDADAAAAAARLVERADKAGLADIAYATVDTPVGSMLLAGTEKGLVRVALPRESFDEVLEDLSARVSPRLVELPRRVDEARREVEEYFEGSRQKFDLPTDWRLITGSFRCDVLEVLTKVPFGEAITYAEAAERAGSPRAHRAAGSACGSNPIPIVIPCHRVVRTGGEMGGYGGGVEMKRFLLKHEGWLDE
jgi:methylated-DNA-[protein]-cysteine S-methyltransferase